MKPRWFVPWAVMLILAARVTARGETLVEDFSGGAGSVDARLAYGLGSWSFTSGVARVRMTETSPYAYPDTASLSPKAPVFTGDWKAAGIELVGFRFMAGSPSPSHLYLELASAQGLLYRKIFPVPEPGEWTTLMAPVLEGAEGGWIPVQGTSGEFADALRDVQSVSLHIQRAGAVTVDHRVDDFFVDQLPRQAAARIAEGGAQLSLDALQSGALYTLQASGSMSGPWRDVQALAATNRSLMLELPVAPDEPAQFYRLRNHP